MTTNSVSAIFKQHLIIAIIFFAGILFANAQKAKVTSANSYLSYGEIAKAKEAIDLASDHEKSKILARTWFIRGKVYHSIFDSKDPSIKGLSPDALIIAYTAYIKATELDLKGRHTDDIKKMLEICALQFINEGVADYANGEFKKALIGFETSIAINKMSEFNKIDTLSIFNAALTAEKMEDYNKAKSYYHELISYHYGGAKIYYFLLNIMKKEGVVEGKVELIQKARSDYPEDNNLIIEELNYYIESGNKQKAINNLIGAISRDPSNYNLYYALGAIYDETGDFENSKAAYEKALTLIHPDYLSKLEQHKEGGKDNTITKDVIDRIHDLHFNILYNFGALYFNEGVKRIQAINSITNNAKYIQEKKDAEEVMVLALPYLEQALDFKPRDRNTMTSLRDLYARTDDQENWKEMQEMLEN